MREEDPIPKHPRWLLLWVALLAAVPGQAHFALAPKIEVAPTHFPQPDTPFLRLETIRASRADFARYLERLTAFDTKYDRVQPSLYLHFSLARGIALFHPDNLHTYVDHINEVKTNGPLFRLAVRTWFEGQAEMFARLEHFRRQALKAGLDREPRIRAVMELYTAAPKTEFLEELVVLGAWEPSVQGLRGVVETIPADARGEIATGIENDTELTPAAEQSRMERRWIEFRRDLLGQARIEGHCDGVSTAADPGTVLLEVNGRQLTLADYLAVLGQAGEARSMTVKKAHCRRLTLSYAAADLVDTLGIAPHRVAAKVAASRRLVLAAAQIVRELGPRLDPSAAAPTDVTHLRRLQAYPEVVVVKDLVIEVTQDRLIDNEALFLDREFVRSRDWRLQRSLAPKHSIHF
jgi:hypothetical protein